jgi:heme-degrading monooxygenase HmoA
VIGVSFWDSRESCDAWRASEAETRRRAAMAPYVVEEQEAFYRGRELAVPVR